MRALVGGVVAEESQTTRPGVPDLSQGAVLYQAVFATMAEGVICQSATGAIIAVNPAAERIQGRPASVLLGKTAEWPDWGAIHEDGTPFPGQDHPSMATLRTGQSYSNVVMGILRGDGTRIWISVNSQPLFAPGEALPYAVITTFHDISGQIRAEHEIRRLNVKLERRVAERTSQLEAALKDLESFSYSVSHDLRAPLRAIDNFSSILQEEHGARLDEEGHRLIRVVRKNAARMGNLIDDMLAFARAGRRELVLADIDFEALVREVLEDLAPSYVGRQVNVNIGPLPRVRADVTALRQVVVNLLGNAIKFTRPRPLAYIDVRGEIAGNEVICSVRDNGVGFEPQYAQKLFGIFQRLHDGEDFEGTGIGLGIVKRIIDKHGGRVWAEGAPGSGATFYFALPRTLSR
jgi:PAS domain S-box-containing protein